MLKAEGVRKRYGSVLALDGFDLTVPPGEVCGLIGHNGAGKSTFARLACGLDRPETGRVTIGGIDAFRRAARRRVGWAPQELALYPTATVRENLRVFGELAGFRGVRLRAEIDHLAAALELIPILGRRVERLSGGQQRRTQTATALLHRPAVLLLDEPTVGADPDTRQALLSVVRSRATDGAAVCYTTHYLPELVTLDATLAVAANGRIIARGDRAALLEGLPGTARLHFDGPTPPLHLDGPTPPLRIDRSDAIPSLPGGGTAEVTWEAENERGTLVIRAARPAEVVAQVLGGLGAEAVRLRGVDISEPTLDDLYRHLAVREAQHVA